MKRFCVAALAAVIGLGVPAAHAQVMCPVKDGGCGYSIPFGSVQQLTLGSDSGFGTRYQRITTPTTTRLWCTDVPGATPAVNGVGSYPIQPGTAEEYPLAGQSYVPRAGVFCTPETGTASGSVRVN